MTSEGKTPATAGEQILYAKVLEIGMYLGLMALFVTFDLYLAGLMEPAIPVDRISGYWGQGVGEYLEAVNRDYLHLERPPTGWAWVGLVDRGDYLNFVGISILAGVTIVCYLAIIPPLVRKRDTAYVVISVVQVFVLALAASGLLTSGH